MKSLILFHYRRKHLSSNSEATKVHFLEVRREKSDSWMDFGEEGGSEASFPFGTGNLFTNFDISQRRIDYDLPLFGDGPCVCEREREAEKVLFIVWV